MYILVVQVQPERKIVSYAASKSLSGNITIMKDDIEVLYL